MKSYIGEKGAKFILSLIKPLEKKLSRIEEEANKTVVDSSLSSTSRNPVQNRAVYEKIKNLTTTKNVGVQVNIDFNDVVAPGLFQYAFYCDVEDRHAPELNTTFYVLNICRDENNMEQIALAEGKNKLYYRTRTNGTWSGWANLLTSDHIANNFVTTDPTMIASAPLAKQLKGLIDAINSRLITTGATFCKDLNLLLTDGVELVNYDTNTLNRPSNYGVCLSVSHYMENIPTNQWSNQLAFSTIASVYYRYKIGTGSWSTWIKLSTAAELQNVSNAFTKMDIGNEYKNITLKTAGWYRIASYTSTSINTAMGSGGGITELSIKRGYSHNNNEVHKIRLLQVFQKSKLTLIDSMYNQKIITKVRHIVGGTESYLEIYYSASDSNDIAICMENGKSTYASWELMTPVKVEESPSNYTIYSTLDL